MFRILFTRHTVFLLISLVLLTVSSACNAASGGPSTAQPSLAAEPTTSDQQEIVIERDTDFGPGPFELLDTRVGLSDLASYTVNLVITFDGTRDGNAENWSKAYTMLATNSPPARQWTIERSGNASSPTSVFMAEMGGLDYERRGEEACLANVIQEGNALQDRLEPASFLSAVIGAEEAGTDRVNDIASNRYTFDQRALGEDGLTEANGEVWVASEGGYIVRYLLTTKAGADYFGEGIEGTMTLSYELTGPNQPVTIQLPDDCPPGLVDAPLLPDAANVEKTPGALTYDTSTSVAEVAAFYQEQIPSLGWTLEGEPTIAESVAFLIYKKDGQNLSVILTASDNVTTVRILLENSEK